MSTPHTAPPSMLGTKVTKQKEVFDERLFKVGTPVAMHTYTSDWEHMRWRTEYGVVKKYSDTVLTIVRSRLVAGDIGGTDETTVRIDYLDGKFYIVPLDKLIEDLQEELNAK